ncbi:phosphoglycerate kinase [Haloplanus rallus]|uniref:Phosphoglycerate kinase n=1 Tax=Haloplanus rallus TaxID=1816183 RepID=A0A6B9FFB7_9EURY|nr:phosphoglycerate kinase [Haloplanus rallus]QGX95820.1 phosphoglycerate kinase [Haloplanus rallus]
MFKTLDDIGSGKRVLVRLDLNSPVEDGIVKDNRRFARHARTVRELVEAGHRVVVIAHQGRPGRDSFVSLDQHADLLAEYVETPVAFVDDVHGEAAVAAIRDLGAGEVLLLENVRMCEDELPERSPTEHADSEFVRSLAPEFDCYVNDAYSAAHRSHASLVGFPRHLPAYAGRVMEAEYEANTSIANREFDGPVTMVLGGAKATDVIDVMSALDEGVDNYLLGGIVGELFLRAAGYDVGYDVGDGELYDHQWADNEDRIRELLAERADRIRLPVDLAYERDEERAEVPVEGVEKTQPLLDVGATTVGDYGEVIEDSAAVFVKGALGVFEDERFADGTVGILESIASTDCFSVIGGGDTSRAIELYGLDEDYFSHVSIAGGAYVRALTGQSLPGVEALSRDD